MECGLTHGPNRKGFDAIPHLVEVAPVCWLFSEGGLHIYIYISKRERAREYTRDLFPCFPTFSLIFCVVHGFCVGSNLHGSFADGERETRSCIYHKRVEGDLLGGFGD